MSTVLAQVAVVQSVALASRFQHMEYRSLAARGELLTPQGDEFLSIRIPMFALNAVGFQIPQTILLTIRKLPAEGQLTKSRLARSFLPHSTLHE